MNNPCENIYKNARKRADLKRDPAAEELGIATRTLDKYENFELRVPDDIVKRMCYLYDYPYLAWQHLKNSELGIFLPDIKETNVQNAALNMASEYMQFEATFKTIISIVADGKIDDKEKKRWEIIKNEVKDFASALLDLTTAKSE